MMMRYILTLILVASMSFVMNAQPLTGRTTPDKMLKTAEEQMALNDYYRALEWYEKYYKEERNLDVANKVAGLHMMLRDYAKAERWYKRVVEKRMRKKAVNPYLPEAYFHYARAFKMNGNYPDAKEYFRLYIAEAEDPAMIEKAKTELAGAELAMKMQPNMEITVANLGKGVNKKYSEYSPVGSGESAMYFTAMRTDKVVELDGKSDDYFSKAYISNRGGGKDGEGWGEPQEVGGININREGYHTGNLTLSKDGRRMYFTRASLTGNSLTESKLYYSESSDEGWSPAKLVDGVNGDYLVKQPAVGELFGSEVLFFVSNMDGGYGGFDIYYSTKRGNEYAPPVNLGDVINTKEDDQTPFYVDGTIYFSSEGHPGIGGFDVFKSVWNGSVWSEPENMGKPFNSSVDDIYYSVDENGYNGFLISNREGTRSSKGKTCCTDIWEVTKEKVVLDLRALTFSDGVALPGASIQLIEMTDNTAGMTSNKTNEKANDFAFPLKGEMAYMVIATKEGFYPDTLQFNTVSVTKTQTFEKKITLIPIPPEPEPEPEPVYETFTINQPIELGNIFYDYDDDKILPDAEKDLSYLLELMNKYPEMVIELSSHTDSRGLTGYNQRLSQRRATSAKNWLIERGVVTERVKDVGYGESQIRNKCVNGTKCSDDEHRFNRRTEFKIIDGPTSIEIEKKRLKKSN